LVERAEGETSEREKEGGELVVGHRMVVRRSCAGAEEGMVKSWRRNPLDSAIGRPHHRRLMRTAL